MLCSHDVPQDAAIGQVTAFMDFANSELAVPVSSPCPETPKEEEVFDEPIPTAGSPPPASHEEADALQLGLYVVSIQLKSTFRRLHRIGACPLIPGRDYRHFELLGFEFPPAHSFSATCGRCFRNGTAQPAEEPVEASSSGESEDAD